MTTFYVCSLTKPSIFMIQIKVEHLISMNFIPFSTNYIFNSVNLGGLLQNKLGSIWRPLIFREMELSPNLNSLCSLRNLPQEVFSPNRTMVEIWDNSNMVSNRTSGSTSDNNTGCNMGSNRILNNLNTLNSLSTLSNLSTLNNQDSNQYISFKAMPRSNSQVRIHTMHTGNNDS